MSLKEHLGRSEKASSMPETIFKLLIFSVVVYTGFLFYLEGRYIVSTVVFSLLFTVIWALLDAEIF